MSLTKDITDTSVNRKGTKEHSPPLNHFSHDHSPMQFYSTHSLRFLNRSASKSSKTLNSDFCFYDLLFIINLFVFNSLR